MMWRMTALCSLIDCTTSSFMMTAPGSKRKDFNKFISFFIFYIPQKYTRSSSHSTSLDRISMASATLALSSSVK